MALDFNNMLMTQQRLAPIDFGGGGSDKSMERERLKLMREQFENVKSQQAKDEELRRLEEAGRNARQSLQSKREQEAAQAEITAKREALKQGALAEFTKLNGAGDIEGARAMVPQLNQLGLQVDLLGEENGLPSYQIGEDPEAASRAKGAIGYPTTDTNPMEAPVGIPSTQDAFQQALGASRQFEQTGQPARAPDQPDYTGGVPRNVIDTGAINAMTQAKLNPAMAGLVGAYPDQASRESAAKTAGAVQGMGLPLKQSIETYEKLRGAPDSMIRGQLAADAQRSQFDQKRNELTPGQSAEINGKGFAKAKTTFETTGMDKKLTAVSAADEIEQILSNDNKEDDVQVANKVLALSGSIGTQSDRDVARALGLSAASTLDQILAFIHTKAEGGFSSVQRDALIGYARGTKTRSKNELFAWMDNQDHADPDRHPDEAKGAREFRNTVIPRAMRQEYEEAKSGKKKGAAGTQPFNMEEDAKRAATETKIPESSRIAFAHNNPGNLKFAGQEGAEQGEPADGGGHWAKFGSVDAGLEALRQQILKDSERGLSVREFVTKYAPPEENDTDRYIEDAARQLKVSPDDALNETDPYDVLRFIAGHESGTKLPDQYSGKRASRDVAPADPAEARRRRLEELRAKKEAM